MQRAELPAPPNVQQAPWCGPIPAVAAVTPSNPSVVSLTWALHPLHPGINPKEIDVLVTNCSIYCPTPSLCSMLVNKFKFRHDVQSYHLGGMGCGNGVMAFSLLRDLLQVGRGAAGP
jgi:predicted naringenin-chalcone synthase